MIKKILIVVVFLIIDACLLRSQNLWPLIAEKNFQQFRSYFSDDSWRAFVDTIRDSSRLITVEFGPENGLVFFEQQNRVQILEVAWKLSGSRVSGLTFQLLGQEIFIVKWFQRISLKNETLKIGDLEIFFEDAAAFLAQPFGRLVFISGKWNFIVKPDDYEEQATLRYVLKRDSFALKNAQAALFLAEEQLNFFSRQQKTDENELPPDFQQLEKFIKENFSFFIEEWQENLYFPVPDDLFAAFLFAQSGGDYYRFIFSPRGIPQISLIDLKNNRMLLGYNLKKAQNTLFFNFQVDSLLKANTVKMFLNPGNGFFQAAWRQTYANFQHLRYLKLNPNITVRSIESSGNPCNYFQNKKDLLVFAAGGNQIDLIFEGNLDRTYKRTARDARFFDNFLLINSSDLLYPQDIESFWELDLKVTVPQEFSVLATGQKIAEKKSAANREFHFYSGQSRELAIALGNFSEIKTISVNGKIKIKFWGAKKSLFKNNLKHSEIEKAFSFLSDLFGKIDLNELNILLQRSEQLGGTSYPGFIIFNIADFASSYYRNLKAEFFSQNLVIFNDVNRDNIIHELAHQWWGGIVGPKDEYDTWINEGMAQFATLSFLEKELSPKRFNALIDQVKKSVSKAEQLGPISYGRRLMNLGANYKDYQAIVYNKSALLFFMLQELMGREQFQKKVQDFLIEKRYKMVTTGELINFFAGEDKLLQQLLKNWIYRRYSPPINYSFRLEQNDLVLDIRQETSEPFVVPLIVKLKEGKEMRSVPLLLQERQREFRIPSNEKLEAFFLETRYAPNQIILERR